MAEINHPYGRALACEAGAVLTSTQAVDQLSLLVKDRVAFDTDGLPGLAEKAIRKVRDKLRFQQFDCSSEELQTFIEKEELESVLMLAHYAEGPKIHTVDFSIGLANRTKTKFASIGSGAALATYLLTDLFTE